MTLPVSMQNYDDPPLFYSRNRARITLPLPGSPFRSILNTLWPTHVWHWFVGMTKLNAIYHIFQCRACMRQKCCGPEERAVLDLSPLFCEATLSHSTEFSKHMNVILSIGDFDVEGVHRFLFLVRLQKKSLHYSRAEGRWSYVYYYSCCRLTRQSWDIMCTGDQRCAMGIRA